MVAGCVSFSCLSVLTCNTDSLVEDISGFGCVSLLRALSGKSLGYEGFKIKPSFVALIRKSQFCCDI